VGNRGTRSRTFSLVFFFLKTYFFRPANNPVFVVLAVFLLFFFAEGSLDRYHVALLLYLSVVAHYFTGNMFAGESSPESGRWISPLERWFQAIPVTGRHVYTAYLVSSFLYTALLFALLTLLMSRLSALPDFVGGETVTAPGPDGETVRIYRGFAVNARGVHLPAMVVLERSLFFDSLARLGAGSFFLAAFYMLVALYITVLHVYRQTCRPSGSARICFLPMTAYLLAGLVLLTELTLSQREIGLSVRFLFDHVFEARLLFAALSLFTAVVTARMARSTWVRLGRS